MRLLVIGSGGREHALIWALQATARQRLELFCAPGNAGIAQLAECAPIGANEISALARFAEESKIDLTMVGPEAPLAAGIVDEFERRGLPIVGAGREAARLESSKAFAKDFMRRHGIPSARYRIASSADEAVTILQSGEFGSEEVPVVVKADGLAAGKGVIVSATRAAAIQGVRDLCGGAVEAEAARRIVIEETLSGHEVSLLLFSDGKDFRLMPAARDHKRVGEGDAGPNTGGMGSITDASLLDDATRELIVREIVEPTLKGCRNEGFPFRGILFIGLMMTSTGPHVLEYNVRFGDPETQAILVRLESDLSQILQAISEGRLGEIEIKWSPDSSACVVLAARGYPGKPEIGSLVQGLDRATEHEHVAVFHAATSRGENGEWLTAGGRVLGVTGTGETLDLALSRCYEAVGDISWEGMHYRRDIGRGDRAEPAASP
jgi:phosphoribosylamine---glycine ligase